jgi:hypothetical protein
MFGFEVRELLGMLVGSIAAWLTARAIRRHAASEAARRLKH